MNVDMKEVKMKEREIAKICKALGDENRVKIIQLLTKGELCACKLLEEFNLFPELKLLPELMVI